MTIERTEALAAHTEAHGQFLARQPVGPDWLAAYRHRAMQRLSAVGFPTTRDEEWRFTSIQPLLDRGFRDAWNLKPPALAASDAGDAVTVFGGPRLVFVDGWYNAGLSQTTGLPAGVRVSSLADAVLRAPDLVRPHLESSTVFERNAFAALGGAFLADGAFIHVPARVTLDQVIHVVHLSTGRGVAAYPHVLAVFDREADATLVESYAGLDGGDYFTNAVTQVVVGDGARVRHYRVQQEHESAFHVATSHWTMGRDAVVETCALAFGSALSRHELVGVLNGANGLLVLNGLSVLHGQQHGDQHTTIDHAQPHCESHELFNGVFADHARGVFNGRIIVRPGAQRTDSKQTNNSMLLSDHARADSQPQLEIYADDVKCTHGATLGPLDPNALFYLRSRGIGLAEARGLLTYGFGAEVIGRIGVPEVRSHLDRVVRQALQVGLRDLAA